MVKKIYFLLIGIILLTSCYKLIDLTMKKTPYFGEELRIDGYYYSNPFYDKYADITTMRVAVFYSDGFCIDTQVELPKNQDTLTYIENEVLLNEVYLAKMKREPLYIGVFQIMYPDIQFESWQFRSWTVSSFGVIVNDTTFIINKHWTNFRSYKTLSEYPVTYRFQQFSPKPDSTNYFVK